MKSTIKMWKAVALAALLTAVMLLSSGCIIIDLGGLPVSTGL